MRIAVASVLVLLACSEPRALMTPSKPPAFTRPRIVAHRGASHDAPENTLAAFRQAWALGVEAVELDVHVTSDGQVVVMHDPSMKRTSGVDLVIADHTLAELVELDVGAWKGPQFAGERIPTLRDVLATIPPGRSLFVELKSGVATVPTVAAAIRDGTPTSATVMLQSFDPDVLAALAKATPDAAAYWTVDPTLDANHHALPYPRGVITDAVRHGFAGLALRLDGVDDAFLADARKAGLFVDVWTANDASMLASLTVRDVRWIETDRPDLAPVGP